MIKHDKEANPIVFLFLLLPYGIMQGYLTVTLAFMYSKSGISVEQTATLIGISLLPNILRFLWAPLVDITFTVKKWYLVTNITASLGIFFMGALHVSSSNVPLLGGIILISFFAGTFTVLCGASFTAYNTSPKTKGLASSYYNIGGIGGVGLGGGSGLWLAERLHTDWMVGAILAIVSLLCNLGLLFVKEPATPLKGQIVTVNTLNLVKDIWATVKAKAGILALFLSLLPWGTGAAGSLFAAMAKDWGTGADTVAIITGVLGGIVTSIGCLLGGWLCNMMARHTVYVMFVVAQLVCALGMAYSPHTQLFYIIWTVGYSLTNGLCYAGFTVFILDAIGKGAASTKYNIYSGLSNIPIYSMTIIDGWANTRFGPSGLLITEAVVAIVSVGVFLVARNLIATKMANNADSAITA